MKVPVRNPVNEPDSDAGSVALVWFGVSAGRDGIAL